MPHLLLYPIAVIGYRKARESCRTSVLSLVFGISHDLKVNRRACSEYDTLYHYQAWEAQT
jgi:hypothetical protein